MTRSVQLDDVLLLEFSAHLATQCGSCHIGWCFADGLARPLYDAMIICEAAGYDKVLMETVNREWLT